MFFVPINFNVFITFIQRHYDPLLYLSGFNSNMCNKVYILLKLVNQSHIYEPNRAE